jgi:hypothetical protein
MKAAATAPQLLYYLLELGGTSASTEELMQNNKSSPFGSKISVAVKIRSRVGAYAVATRVH